MKAFVITLKNNEYSEQVANRCIQSANKFNLKVETFYGVDRSVSKNVMESHGLKWTWAKDNTELTYCPITGLRQHPYMGGGKPAPLDAKIGCSMSHFLLWKKCVELNTPMLILEHDSVFLRPLPEIDFKGICQINDPNGATRKGGYWSQMMAKRGGVGAFPKTGILSLGEEKIPDGLAGNSAYCIKPWAAQDAIDKTHKVGVWPNDAILCVQVFDYLEEYYPFITKVMQGRSTTTM